MSPGAPELDVGDRSAFTPSTRGSSRRHLARRRRRQCGRSKPDVRWV